MGLFGNRNPRLPSFEGADLNALLQDEEWGYAIGEAGIDPDRCEIVLRLTGSAVASGTSPKEVKPAVLFGQGDTLAIAFPAEREIRIVKRDKAKAELQTQQSGWLQVVFLPPSSRAGFTFCSPDDNLRMETPEGDRFAQIMAAFLDDELKPQQIIGTPQSLVLGGVSIEPAAPVYEEPEEATRRTMLNSVHSSLAEMMEKYQLCFEKAESVEKAFGMANAEFVDGVRQHEISREHFRNLGVEWERELVILLGELRAATITAQNQWKDLVFLLPGPDDDVIKIGQWCDEHDVDPEVSGSIISNGMFTGADFGATRESFWAENERIIAVFKRHYE